MHRFALRVQSPTYVPGKGHLKTMPKLFKVSILAVSVVLLLVVFAGGLGLHGVHAAGTQADDAYRQIMVYSEVLKRIQSDYVVDPNIPQVTTGALRGLVESLDPDSSYLTPEDYAFYKAHLNDGKAQIGLTVSKRYGYATVVSVLPGSAAEKANISDGDIIEAIGDRSTRQIPLALIDMMLTGQPGSSVTFSVVRPRHATPDKVTLTRSLATFPAVGDQQYEGGSILYLKPQVLDHERVQEIEAKLKAMPKNGNKKILLDLRDVATGDMSEGVRLANFFLSSGTITTLEGQKVAKQTFTADPSKTINAKAPLVVLANHGSSGAAEVVAAAMMDNKRADVVGDRTFGEGAQQKLIELPDGAALILSIAKYETPAGKILQDDAVTPNVQVASNFDQDDSADDEDATATDKPAPAPVKPAVHVDDQLAKALDLLKQKAA